MARLPSDLQRQRIWDASYAAAFVRAFNEAYEAGIPFDRALQNNAEQAITIADAAVEQLVQWKVEGN